MSSSDNLDTQKLKKPPFWFYPYMGLVFSAGLAFAHLGFFSRRPLEVDPVLRPQTIVAHAIDNPRLQLNTFAPSAFPQGKVASVQAESLSSAGFKVPYVENSVKTAVSTPSKKVIFAVGKSLTGSVLNHERLREELTTLQSVNLSLPGVYTLEQSYTSLVRTLLTNLYASFCDTKPEFTEYRITRPEIYQPRKDELSGLSGVRQNGRSVNFTKQDLHNLFTARLDRQTRTVSQFGKVFASTSALEIAEQVQTILTECQEAYIILRQQELAMPTFGTGLQGLASELAYIPRSGRPRDVKVYWKPFERVDWQVATSFNFDNQSVSLGLGQARFQKIPKTRAGFVYGADVGPKLRRIIGPPLSYRYDGIEGRVFLGVGLEI